MLARVQPHGIVCLAVKNTQTPGDEILEEITVWKNGLLFKSRIRLEDVQKEFGEEKDADNWLSACPEHCASFLSQVASNTTVIADVLCEQFDQLSDILVDVILSFLRSHSSHNL